MTLPGSSTIADAKAWLRERLREGAECPVCTQYAKTYARTIHSSMASALVRLYRNDPQDWQAFADVLEHRQIADAGKLRYWGLIEEERVLRPDGGRAGWWRLTALGRMFVRREVWVQKYALVYDGTCLGLDGPSITITDALGERFDYAALMAA